MGRFLQVFYIFFSAALLALAIPNELFKLGSPLFALVSLIPLYAAYSRFKSYKEASALFALHTFLVHLMTSFWLAFFKDFAVFTLGASAVGTGIIGGFIGLVLYLPFAQAKKNVPAFMRYARAGAFFIPLKIFWFAAVYVFYEWIKSIGFLGYPWGTVSSAFFLWKLPIQIADITGTYGVSFLAALFAAVCGEGHFLRAESMRFAGGGKNVFRKSDVFQSYAAAGKTAIALFLLTIVYGTYQYARPRKAIKFLNTIMVQQNADPWLQTDDNETILLSQKLVREKLDECAASQTEPDLVAWSECCLRYTFPNAQYHYNFYPAEDPLVLFIQQTGVPFIIGAPYKPDEYSGRVFNAAVLFDKDGVFRGAYGKNHLVPFAEAIPFSNIPVVRDFLRSVIHITAGWAPGDRYVLFEVPARYPAHRTLPAAQVISLTQSLDEQTKEDAAPPSVKIASPICFDDAFPDVCTPLAKSGAELFLNLTDDSWSRLDSAEYQHFTVAAYRAIELRTTLARSTNAGFSAVVDPTGRIRSAMQTFQAAALFTKIPVYERRTTVYMRFGDWLPELLFALILAEAACVFRAMKTRRNEEPPSERKKLDRIRKRMLKEARQLRAAKEGV
ncbi:MAG: apolipoprotein N-acyltransferase [Treponema sp.]